LDQEKEKKVDVLLEEYQACHRNRNHYDSVRWTIGSIFIAISSAIFGVSLTKDVMDEPNIIMLLAVFSLVLIFVWYLFVQHVNPYVWQSIIRFHEIEKELREMRFDIRLHKSIYNVKQKMKGIYITCILLMAFIIVWLLRIALIWQNLPLYSQIVWFFLVGVGILSVYHFYTYARVDGGNKIRTILEEEEKTEMRMIEERIQRFEEEIKKMCKQENQDELKKVSEEFRNEIMERIKILRMDSKGT